MLRRQLGSACGTSYSLLPPVVPKGPWSHRTRALCLTVLCDSLSSAPDTYCLQAKLGGVLSMPLQPSPPPPVVRPPPPSAGIQTGASMTTLFSSCAAWPEQTLRPGAEQPLDLFLLAGLFRRWWGGRWLRRQRLQTHSSPGRGHASASACTSACPRLSPPSAASPPASPAVAVAGLVDVRRCRYASCGHGMLPQAAEHICAGLSRIALS